MMLLALMLLLALFAVRAHHRATRRMVAELWALQELPNPTAVMDKARRLLARKIYLRSGGRA